MLRYLLILLVGHFICLSVQAQEWQLTKDEVVTDNVAYESVYLNGYTIELHGALSTTYLYGSGSIIAVDNPSLAICSYECGINLPNESELWNYSIPEQCDTTLGLFDYTPQELELKGIIHVYDILGRLLFKDKYSCNCLHELEQGFYIIHLYMDGQRVEIKKLIVTGYN